MPFSENETETILQQLEDEFWSHRRPPLHLRDKVREGQRIEGQSIELFLNRPAFQRSGEWIEERIARLRYIRSRDLWEIDIWLSDLEWQLYEPFPKADTLPDALAEIHRDKHACFFG